MDQSPVTGIEQYGPWGLVVAIVLGGGAWIIRWFMPRCLMILEAQHKAALAELAAARKSADSERDSFRAILEQTRKDYLAEMQAQRQHDAERYERLAAAVDHLAERVNAIAPATKGETRV